SQHRSLDLSAPVSVFCLPVFLALHSFPTRRSSDLQLSELSKAKVFEFSSTYSPKLVTSLSFTKQTLVFRLFSSLEKVRILVSTVAFSNICTPPKSISIWGFVF